MYYELIEIVSILAITGGSLAYLFSRWFPYQKSLVARVLISRFPKVSRLFRYESGSEDGSNSVASGGCFGCAPTGSCGSCPTNRGQ